MKLMAFMVTTTIRMVRVTLRSGSSENTPPFGVGSQGSDWPLQTRMPAAATWAASRLMALSPHRSSAKPTTTTRPPASSSPASLRDPAWNGSCKKESRLATSSPATRPPYMARPPSSGVGVTWVSLARGSCIARVRKAIRRTSGVSR
jgi:hypothetical protein